MATATFAAGCFWGVEAEFRRLDGVTETEVGYTGGTVENPSYELVCTDTTGHAEAVRVEFDPNVVSYDELLEVFWSVHDPTTPNRQGWDIGSQYRSAIFVHDQEQEVGAHRSKAEAQTRIARPIVTEIVDAAPFYRAEDYHQRYLEKKGQAACNVVLKAKVEAEARS
jgi:peptide-methionine (S)-S-oxide reductase